MLKQCVALLHRCLLDLVISRGFATVFLTWGKTIITPLFNGPEVLTTSTLTNLTSLIVHNSFPTFHLVLNRD